MAASLSGGPPGLKLDLADGQRWLIRPVDHGAAVIVAELGEVMRLGPGEVGRELCVAVCGAPGESDRPDAGFGGAVVCRLAAPTNRGAQVIQMQRIAAAVTRQCVVRGGLLLHGALAEYRGSGFILAGPSGIGKSTASRRLPSPWRSLCDDATLVVRDRGGHWWAHPWPTWSRYHNEGPGGSWAVEHAVPLRAVLFLSRSPSDQLEPLNTTPAIALTLESAINLAWEAGRLIDENAARAISTCGVSAARTLAAAVPAYSLGLSLNGRFWEEVERVLPVGAWPGLGEDCRGREPDSIESLVVDDSLRVVYTGTSMNPTLVEPELLEVKPYLAGRPRPGDVICFRSPGADATVVHRVVAVEQRDAGEGRYEEGIRTGGDNNAWEDAGVRSAADIIGRVTAARRGARRRRIHGGRRGLAALRRVRWAGRVGRWAGSVPHRLFDLVVGFGPFDRLLPRSLRPRAVLFEARHRVYLKLLMGGWTVGHCDDRRERWFIRRPFRLFVDGRTLGRAAAPGRRR